MKNLIVMLTSVLCVMSCTDNNDDSISNSVINDANLIGEWAPNKSYVNGVLYPFDHCDALHRLIFTNNNLEAIYYDGEFCETMESFNSSYSIVSDSLHYTTPGLGNIGFSILELSSTTLKIERTDAISGNLLTAVYKK